MKNKFLMTATVPSMIGQFNMENIKILLDMGYEVHVACNFKDRSVWTDKRTEEFEKQLLELGVKKIQIDYARSPYSILKLIKSYFELKNIIKIEKYVCLHCHTPVASMISRLAAKKTDTKVIYTAHGFHFYKGAPLINWILYYPIEKLLSYYTDVLITINKEDYQRAKKFFHAKKTKYIPGVGIDIEKIQSIQVDRNAKRKELGINEKDFFLLSVGELNRNKNHEIVIRALSKLRNTNVKYAVCGQGELEKYLENVAVKLGVKDQLFLLGFRTDIIEIYKSADLFLFPSKREGLSVALMEAMACGLPCIVSKIRGNTDLIEDKKGGYIWKDVKNEMELVNCCNKLIQNRTKWENMGKENREKVALFDKKIVRNKMKKIYEKMDGLQDEDYALVK